VSGHALRHLAAAAAGDWILDARNWDPIFGQASANITRSENQFERGIALSGAFEAIEYPWQPHSLSYWITGSPA